MFFKTYSAEMEDMFGVPLRGIRATKKFRARTKYKDRRWATRFAQTISPPVLTSAHGTPSCANFPPKSPRPHPHSLQKGTCNRVLFSALFIWEDSNNIAAVTKARPEDFTNGDTFKPRRFAVFQVCLQNNQRQKQQKQKCVKNRKVLLIVKAAAKLCCRRRSLYSTKTRNQGRVVFPSEISTLPLTPHFCSETLSIILRT